MKILLLFLPLMSFAQTPLKVALVKMPYVGERNTAEKSGGPDYVESGGLQKQIDGLGSKTKPVSTVALTPDEQKSYGEWNRLALANGDLAKIVAEDRRDGYLPVGLLANCNAAWGCSRAFSTPALRRSRCEWAWCTSTRTAITTRPRQP